LEKEGEIDPLKRTLHHTEEARVKKEAKFSHHPIDLD
jgi:hypothetical protein